VPPVEELLLDELELELLELLEELLLDDDELDELLLDGCTGVPPQPANDADNKATLRVKRVFCINIRLKNVSG
jgi:hypothetical protein